MKKVLSLVMALCCATFLFAQGERVFFCDFSDGMPEDFTIIDNDSKTLSMASMYNFDGNGWGFVSNDCAAAMYGMMATDGLPAAITGSFGDDSGEASDNWMITPAIDLTNASAATLTWKANQEDDFGQYQETYEVLVSTTGTATADFTNTVYGPFSTELKMSWTSRSADLSAYAGQTIYIAYHLTTPGTNGGALFIDDIEVTAAMGGGEETVSLANATDAIVEGAATVKAVIPLNGDTI